MNKITKILAGVLPVVLLAACATQKPVEQIAEPVPEAPVVAAPAAPAPAEEVAPPPAQTSPVVAEKPLAVDPLSDPNSPLAKRTIYFDFDKSIVKEEYRATVEAHANYLAQHSNVTVTLEGHADERGSREYNIGLGERRNQAVDQVMSLLGVAKGQIKMVSYGEERPVSMGHDETSWAKNRRVEIVYSGR
jgi:peptidoglycan-associated lipoprotein